MLSVNICQLDYHYAVKHVFTTFDYHFLDFSIQICSRHAFIGENIEIW